MIKPDPYKTAQEVWETKYNDAKVMFLAGSVVRNEATPYSDLDLVVVYDDLKHAWRESFMFKGWHIEAFVHDPHTLKYFFEEIDGKSGRPSLPQMVVEGIPIPEKSDFSENLKTIANDLLVAGPPQLSKQELESFRYGISDLLDDLRSPRNKQEAMATGTRLYQLLADFWLRSQNKWSANGKTIPRVLSKTDKDFADKYQKAFDDLFIDGRVDDLVQLTKEVLNPFGGYLFDGHRLNAPENWKK